MANPRYNSQVTQPRGTKARVGKMGGGMMMQRPMYKAGGKIAGAARKAQQHGYYTPDMGMKGGKMYAKGGKVSGKKKIIAGGVGKIKNYPGIKKLIEMNKKGKKRFKDGGSALKSVDKSKNPGLAKLPTQVRNKMGYMKDGGKVKKSLKEIKKENRKQKLKEIMKGDISKEQIKNLYHGRKFKDGGKVKKSFAPPNTRRMNRLEELGRVDAERARTQRGKRNLKAEKKRIVKELRK
jgi:hypothetical protein